MIKLGLCGFFNVGALADDLILEATKQMFLSQEGDVIFNTDLMRTHHSKLNNYDLIVLCGGTLLGKLSINPFQSINQWHSKLKSKLVVFGTGYRYEKEYDPLPEPFLSRMNLLFEKSDLVSLRGPVSKQFCIDNGIKTPDIFCYGDPVCGLNLSQFKKSNVAEFIGGNVRDIPDIESTFIKDKDAFYKHMAEIYTFLIDEYKTDLHLISYRHIFPDNDNDMNGAQHVLEYMSDEHVALVAPGNVQDLIYEMSKCRFFFGNRFHSSVLSALLDIPFVGLDYQFHKMKDFMATLNSDTFLHVEDLNLNSFLHKYESCLQKDYSASLCEIKTKQLQFVKRSLEL